MRDHGYAVDNKNPADRKRFIRGMFDSIVPTYDLLNRLLSLGIDRTWRKRLVRMTGNLQAKPALDLCCGTGDLSAQLYNAGADLVSLDFSLPMLVKGKRTGWLKGGAVAADATRLPFRDNSFHLVTIAFGIRNIPDIDIFLNEVFRVLQPGGKFVILELTRPRNNIVSLFYTLYLRFVLPVAGGIISGKWAAYRYLARTIATFLAPENIARRMGESGMRNVLIYRFTFGIATIISSEKCS
ncbi:MAG TPA: bifunctional demethylmenaquinone methyltransferase/2-methoxy-6-polyprenyl-1,4-benzoquinol methylase UbiE [Spirochaetota bacterium]|nr:bifunctional demethylmenaquinone methyltransferase/2-methoxy-6-polyprenyl-1,4-benzoquinol methylase UbiE [Spirochaetota bacterium]HPI91040.1 bifunctional demethylmenaquinone methyltransferase/2-methoxy-6-polyprenyl-1,4-benzoquinol methylase UbiE [Spirochaetota bacterium]HPR47295.1 bifunctional demethylmenaquinone methyltransferase/2-methoxy-6-polyprenyl-1,4-benzoquinol methylase UbiE [Spirochaetota bacterium]